MIRTPRRERRFCWPWDAAAAIDFRRSVEPNSRRGCSECTGTIRTRRCMPRRVGCSGPGADAERPARPSPGWRPDASRESGGGTSTAVATRWSSCREKRIPHGFTGRRALAAEQRGPADRPDPTVRHRRNGGDRRPVAPLPGSDTRPPRALRRSRQAGDPERPQTIATWYDAAAYCNWLSRKEGLPRNSGATSPIPTAGMPKGCESPRTSTPGPDTAFPSSPSGSTPAGPGPSRADLRRHR